MLPGIGVFGTASEVKVLVPILRDKGFKIEAIWGRTTKEAEVTAKELSIPFYTNRIDDVLLKKDVDLIFIICAPYLHSQISVKALGIGKHVVCDKPMGLGQADALKMVRGSQYYPSLISLVNYSLRFLPAFVHMKRMLNEEYVGPMKDISLIGKFNDMQAICQTYLINCLTLFYFYLSIQDVRVQMGSLLRDKFDWLCDSTMGGGALNLIGSHVVDLVTFLLEKQAVKVHGVIKTYTKTTQNVNGIRQVTAPDFCNFQMELENGIIVTVSLLTNFSCSTFTQEVLVVGCDGHMIVRGGDLFGQRNTTASGAPVDKEEALYVDVEDLYSLSSGMILPRPYIKGVSKMVGALRESFVTEQSNWVKEPVQSAATFEDGLYVQAVLDAVRKSSDSKSWVKVSIMSESPTNHAKIMTAARMSAVVMH